MDNSAIDINAHAAVRDAMGEIFDEVISTFLDYVPQQIHKLGVAIEQLDCDNVFNFAHAIKSSSGSIGALGLASTAEQIELLGRKSSIDGVNQHYQTLQNQYREVVEFLQRSDG